MEDYAEDIDIHRSTDLSRLLNQVRDTKDLYYIILMMLQSGVDNKDNNSLLPEMMMIMDEVSMMNLIWYFGGETITIPKKEDIRDYLHGLLLYYYYDVQGEKWSDCFELIGVDYNRTESARLIRSRKLVMKDLTHVKLPGVKDDDK